jgi:hypothetical protein
MCGIGSIETWPSSYAVASPPRFAASACAASWSVDANRKAAYQTIASTT